MANDFFQTTADALKDQVDKALRDAKIYNIDVYGWLNADDIDPEYVGHAMWQMHGPPDDELIFFEDRPLPRRPADTEMDIVHAGEDFCGMMQASRYSIGLALVWSQDARSKPFDNTGSLFWLHHIDTLLKLEIASDRLRKVLIVAATDKPFETYKKEANKRGRKYAAPFEDAIKWLEKRNLTDKRLLNPAANVSGAGVDIFERYIEPRNAIVHEMATQWATVRRDQMRQLQAQYDDEQKHGYVPPLRDKIPWDEISAHSNAEIAESNKKIDDAVGTMCAWYLKLIDVSNDVFQIEYWARLLGQRAGP